AAGGFTKLEASEAADDDVLAHLGNGIGHKAADILLGVPDEVLLRKHNCLGGGFAVTELALELGPVLVGHIFAVDEAWAHGSYLHGDILGERLEIFGAGNEVGFAANFHHGTNAALGVDVGVNEAVVCIAVGLLAGLGQTLL